MKSKMPAATDVSKRVVLGAHTAEDLMTPNPVSISEHALVREAAAVLTEAVCRLLMLASKRLLIEPRVLRVLAKVFRSVLVLCCAASAPAWVLMSMVPVAFRLAL